MSCWQCTSMSTNERAVSMCMAEQDRVGGALSAVAFVRRVGDIIEVLSLLHKNSALQNASLEVRHSNRS